MDAFLKVVSSMESWVLTLTILGALSISALSSRILYTTLTSTTTRLTAVTKDVSILYSVVTSLIPPKKRSSYKSMKRRSRWNSQHR